MRIDPKWAWQRFEPSAEHSWDQRLATHLFRRAGFSATQNQINRSVDDGFEKSLERIFDFSIGKDFETQMNATARYLKSGNDVRRVSAWWLLRMIRTPTPLLEKMTLFWHGHFATSGQKVNDSSAMLTQNQILRQYALGPFEPMVQAISRDVAMLTYLDSTENRKTRPNENYARELMELFCLGLDRYSEQDIKAVARCFTGWEVRRVSGAAKFHFNENQHDRGTKSFLGSHGNFGGEEAVRIVLNRDDAKLFIAKKLIRFFVFDDVAIETELAQPLADWLATTEFDIGKAVRMILESNLFYSKHSMGQKIRGPVELAAGLLRQLNASGNMERLMDDLQELGQLPLFPPNVKGWDGGRRWLNASTILGRANLVRRFARREGIELEDGSLDDWGRANGAPDEVTAMVEWLCELMLAQPITGETKQTLVEIAHQASDNESRFELLLTSISVIPEFQLN